MMASLPPIDSGYLLDQLVALLNIPSPTGYTDRAITHLEGVLEGFSGLQLNRTRKGALVATWPGVQQVGQRALTAHVDTLGAMVKEIKPNGRLRLTRIGGVPWNAVEGEGCTIFPRVGKSIRGAILLTGASTHVRGTEFAEQERDEGTMEVRLDARTSSVDETRALGIGVGDFVAFDPRVEIVDGFVRSRHLDDKAGIACLLAAVQALHSAGCQLAKTTVLHFSNYEEVGHGASAGIPPEVTELVVVDMAAIGEGQTSDEFHATICVKDSGGPYHYGLSQRLRSLAEAHHIPHKVDIYPYYRSDGSAYWQAGGDVAVALIGPGVDASHNYERTHSDSLVATTQWIMAYMLS